MPNFESWLNDSTAQRVITLELHHSAGIEFISDVAFATQPSDQLANVVFDDVLASALDISSRIDGQLEVADIEIVNDGQLNHYLNYFWRGFDVVIKLGDASWSYDDFQVIANQINGGISSYADHTIRFSIYDRSALLDVPVDRERINDQVIPFILGTVIGVTALRTSTQSLDYKVCSLPLVSLVVRDGNGPELTHTPDLLSASFTLSAYTPRAVICDVVEPHNNAQQIFQWVADYYSFNLSDSISLLPDYELGLLLDGDVTGRMVLDEVCRSLGANWFINALGELAITLLDLPASADLHIFEDDLEAGSVQLIENEEPTKTLTLRHARNYSPLSEVAGSIEDSDPALANRLRTEWREAFTTQTLSAYPVAPDITADTLLADVNDVEAELQRRISIRSQRRAIWSMTAFITSNDIKVGKSIEVHHPKLEGKIGVVLSTRLSPTNDSMELEVWL